MNVLVTGGAGYIGSHTVRLLVAVGHQVTVLDDLSAGHRGVVPPEAELVHGDINNKSLLKRVFKLRRIGAVLHFAGVSDVSESVREPLKYHSANLANSLVLLQAMVDNGVKRLVFPSSAAVYGLAPATPLRETHPLKPINPYGRSKMLLERAIQDFHAQHGMSFAILRCFNVAGASPDGACGEAHWPETHLIPRLLTEQSVTLHGTDYATSDGTCVRDYCHVVDVARAHVLALESGRNGIYNVGSERGHSVLDVVALCEQVVGRRLNVERSARREGDPPVLTANCSRIRRELGFQQCFPRLRDTIAHAWSWHSGGLYGDLVATATSLTMASAMRMPSQAALVIPPA